MKTSNGSCSCSGQSYHLPNDKQTLKQRASLSKLKDFASSSYRRFHRGIQGDTVYLELGCVEDNRRQQLLLDQQTLNSSNDTTRTEPETMLEEMTGPAPQGVSFKHQQVVTWSGHPVKLSSSFSKNNVKFAERNAMKKNFALRKIDACLVVNEPALLTSPWLPSPQSSPPSTMQEASQAQKMQPAEIQCAVDTEEIDLQRCWSSSNSSNACIPVIESVCNNEERPHHDAHLGNQVNASTAPKPAQRCILLTGSPEAETEEEADTTSCNYVASSKGNNGDHSVATRIASIFKVDDLAMNFGLQDPPQDKTRADKMDRKLENALERAVAADTKEAGGEGVSVGKLRYETQGLNGSDAMPTILATLLESNPSYSGMPWVEAIFSVTGQEYGKLDASVDCDSGAFTETFFDDSLEGQRPSVNFDPPKGKVTPSEDLGGEVYDLVIPPEDLAWKLYEGTRVKIRHSAALVEAENLLQGLSFEVRTDNTMKDAEQAVTAIISAGTRTAVKEEPTSKTEPDANLLELTYETPKVPCYELQKEPGLECKRHPCSVSAEHDLVAMLRAELRLTMKMEPRKQEEPEGEMILPLPTEDVPLSANGCTASTPAEAGMTPGVNGSATSANMTSPAERWSKEAAGSIEPLPRASGPGLLKSSGLCSYQPSRTTQEANAIRTDSPPHVRRLNRDNPKSSLPLLKQSEEPPVRTQSQHLRSLLQQQQKDLEYKPQLLRQPRAPWLPAGQVGPFAINNVADKVVSKSSASGTPDREGCDCEPNNEPDVGLPQSPRGVMEVVDQAVTGAWDSSKPPCFIHVLSPEDQEHVEDLSVESDFKRTSSLSMMDVTMDALKSMVRVKWGLKFPPSNEYQEEGVFVSGKTSYASFYHRRPHRSFENPTPPIESETPKGPVAEVLDKCFKLASFLHSDATTLCSDLSTSEPNYKTETKQTAVPPYY
jgi:hypothetical protein